jgi:hypothetical protein
MQTGEATFPTAHNGAKGSSQVSGRGAACLGRLEFLTSAYRYSPRCFEYALKHALVLESSSWISGPHSDLHLAEGAGHMVHHVVPHEVMAAIDSLAKADPGSLNDAMQPAAKLREANTPATALQSGRAATDPVLSG